MKIYDGCVESFSITNFDKEMFFTAALVLNERIAE